ncbi:hypothetical protein GCM10027093_50300 [Paraburkholderia jirisanensis]
MPAAGCGGGHRNVHRMIATKECTPSTDKLCDAADDSRALRGTNATGMARAALNRWVMKRARVRRELR